MCLPLEGQHAVHHVLQHLWPGDGPLLVDVADDEHSDPRPLGQLHQRHGALLHLSDAAGHGVGFARQDGLHGVHDQNLRFDLLHRVQNGLQIVLCQDVQVLAADVQPVGAELDLSGGFLTGDIQNRGKLTQMVANLQHQRGFPDARRTADEHQRPLHCTAAQHVVQLPHAGLETQLLRVLDLAEPLGLRTAVQAAYGGLGTAPHPLRRLLYDGVPVAAGGTAALPFGELVATFGTEKDGLRFHRCHSLPLVSWSGRHS